MSAESWDELEREIANEDQEEYYALLNIPRTATQDEIRSAYRRLCRIYHPDRLAHCEFIIISIINLLPFVGIMTKTSKELLAIFSGKCRRRIRY